MRRHDTLALLSVLVVRHGSIEPERNSKIATAGGKGVRKIDANGSRGHAPASDLILVDAPACEEKFETCQGTKSGANARSPFEGAARVTQPDGIDFGTSNSSIGVSDASGPRLLPIQRGATSVPTALFFSLDDNSPTYGHEALGRTL